MAAQVDDVTEAMKDVVDPELAAYIGAHSSQPDAVQQIIFAIRQILDSEP